MAHFFCENMKKWAKDLYMSGAFVTLWQKRGTGVILALRCFSTACNASVFLAHIFLWNDS